MTKKIIKRMITLFIILFLCTLASAKGKSDIEIIEEAAPELDDETELQP